MHLADKLKQAHSSHARLGKLFETSRQQVKELEAMVETLKEEKLIMAQEIKELKAKLKAKPATTTSRTRKTTKPKESNDTSS